MITVCFYGNELTIDDDGDAAAALSSIEWQRTINEWQKTRNKQKKKVRGKNTNNNNNNRYIYRSIPKSQCELFAHKPLALDMN